MSWYKDSILVENVYYMLYYAFGRTKLLKPPKQTRTDNVSTDEKFEDVQGLFAEMLSRGIGQQRKQGLHREYLERTEDLPVIRGKIDMAGTNRNRLARKRLISCEYDELSENTLSNQILKTAAMLLIREKKVEKKYKNALRREMQYFSMVDEIRDPTTIQWSRVRYHRNNRSYSTLLFICQLILRELLLTENGKHKLKDFFDEKYMENIYEKFILGYYSREFPQLKTTAQKIDWIVDNEDDALPKMQSDITLSFFDEEKNIRKVLIIDAKWYKQVKTSRKFERGEGENSTDESEAEVITGDNSDDRNSDGKFRSAHLYQIFTYVKNKEAKFFHVKTKDGEFLGETPHTVSGMLLYARPHKKKKEAQEPSADGEQLQPKGLDPSNRLGEYKMSGNWIHVRTLDLSKKFKDDSGNSVKDQLDDIVNKFFSEMKQQG